MKYFLAGILLIAGLALAQDPPPLPTPPVGFDWASTNSITLKWEHIPHRELFSASDKDGNPLHLFYRVYHSVAVDGPYAVVATTTNNIVLISNVVLRTHFFYVTSVNPVVQQIESEPSAKVASPIESVAKTKLIKP